MATVKTIKPGGGGDYTTLAAWEDWADGQASADQWAECYTGGDLGDVTLDGWTATPDATHYPRIYTPLSERHQGKLNTGAYVLGSVHSYVQYTRVEGLRIEDDSATYWALHLCSPKGCVVDSNLVKPLNAAASYVVGIGFESLSAGNSGNICRNNIVYGSKVPTNCYSVYCSATSTSSSSSDLTIDLYNNTVVNPSVYGFWVRESHRPGHPATLTATASNNIAMDSGTKDFFKSIDYGSVTGSYNMSSDATGDDWGATGSLINKVAANQFVDKASDWNLLSTANAIDAGTTIGSFDWDALHVDGDGWRPQGSAWDMGALERAVAKGRSFGVIIS